MRKTVKAARDFWFSPNGRNVVLVSEGDNVDVTESSLDGMIRAGQVVAPVGVHFAEQLAERMTTKDTSGQTPEPKEKPMGQPGGIDGMDKNQLEAHARKTHGVELDRRKSLKNLLIEVRSLEAGV